MGCDLVAGKERRNRFIGDREIVRSGANRHLSLGVLSDVEESPLSRLTLPVSARQ